MMPLLEARNAHLPTCPLWARMFLSLEQYGMGTKIKNADSKGRVALGKEFANVAVIIERIGPTELRIVKARVVPEREAWLLENELARSMIRRGVQQATAGEFSNNPPDLDADHSLLNELED